MNPVTARLVHALDDQRIARFVALWDALEKLAVRVSKQGATREDEREWATLRRRLGRAYRRHEAALACCWPGKQAGGQPLTADPFRTLIAPDSAAAFQQEWGLMQQLAAAREALNDWLLGEVQRRGRSLT